MSASLRSLPAWEKASVKIDETSNFHGFCLPRCAHNSVCVNEDLLIWGGYNDEPIQTMYCPNDLIWVFNVDLDCWFCYQTTGKYPIKCTGAASVLLWPNWYIIGGNTYDGDVSDVYTLNLLTLVWDKVECAPAHLLGRDKASVWAWNNRIYIFGGYGMWSQSDLWTKGEDHFVVDYFKGWNDQLLYLDFESKEWIRPEYEGCKPLARAAHSTLCIDDVMYLFGGRHENQRLNDLHCLDMKSQTWSGRLSCLGEQPCGRSWHTMTRIGKSDLLLYGGFSSSNVPLDDAWLLNKDNLSWSKLNKNTGLPRLWHTASTNSLGDVLVFGGCSSNILNNEIQMATSDKVLLFRTKPFSLVRMCLHLIFKDRDKTKIQWDLLPQIFQEWLHTKSNIMKDPIRASLMQKNIILGHGSCLKSYS